MHINKSLYSLADAAKLLSCKPGELIHLATRGDLVLLVGVPDNIRFRTYDAQADLIDVPALLEPELLALSASQCLKIELNGKTEQIDFQEGFIINTAGQLQRIMPSYGRPRLNHGWAYWRTYDGPFPKKIEVVPERVFVSAEEIERLQGILLPSEQSKTLTTSDTENEVLPKSFKAEREQVEATSTISKRGSAKFSVVEPQNPESRQHLAVNSVQLSPSLPSAERPIVIIRIKQVQLRTGLSRSTIYNKLNPQSPQHDPSFPKQKALGTTSVGWVESEVDDWLKKRLIAK